MALRTAPCPQCKATIVFGERACRNCKLVFNYGPNPPPEPSQAEVFDALLEMQVPSSTPPTTASAPSAPSVTEARPAPTATAPDVPAGTLAGLDTGRFSVGDVDIDDVPGLIDSTLFRALTPDTVDVAPIPGLELDRVNVGDVAAGTLAVDTGRAGVVGDVHADSVPGLYGSDMFADHVDIAAGADNSPILEVSHIRAHVAPQKGKKGKTGKTGTPDVDPENLSALPCPSCGTIHARPRCPACATPHHDLLEHD